VDRSAPFSTQEEPTTSIREFMMQISKYLRCSKSCFILALVYIDRVVQTTPHVVINNKTVHRLLLVGVLVASKFLDDGGFDNAHYAQIGGMDTKELNRLEVKFLSCLNWNLHVRRRAYDWYSDLIGRVIAGE